jgi:micrococcal nuclease
MMRIIIFIILVASTSSAVGVPALATTTIISGIVTKVRDGDTILVGKVPIRLNGVSAPELKEPLGAQSKLFMQELVLGKPVRCKLNGKKTYDRFVGICYFGDRDIGAALIEAGLALDCPKFSGERYVGFEKAVARDRIRLPRYCR